MGRGKSKAAAARQQMPLCQYGSACTRPDCIYRHVKEAPGSSGRVCMAYVAGSCAFGHKCRDIHVSDEEAEAMRAQCASKPCAYGDSCTNPLCLYLHPSQAAQEAMERLALAAQPESGAGAKLDNLLPDRRAELPTVARAPAPRPLPLHPAASPAPARATRLPEEFWVDSAARDARAAFAIPDPLERFAFVMGSHGLPATALDLHFQSQATVGVVLDGRLRSTLREHGRAWLLTGTGHHAQGHQQRGGVLFDCVGTYLREAAGEPPRFTFTPVVDANGHEAGYHVEPSL